jgi:hypothetical protein
MSNFALEELKELVGKVKVYKLFVDGVCQFDSFCVEVKKNGNMVSDLKAVMRNLNDISNDLTLPYNKFHPLKQDANAFEIKKNSLRVYLIRDSKGHIIVIGSIKGNQDTDISKVIKLHQRYLASL